MTRSDVTRQAQYAKAVAALLNTCTIQEAADAIGVTTRTMQRWMQDADFITQLHAAQDAMLTQAALRVVGLSGQAVGVLADVLADEDAPIGVKTRAADLALAHSLKYTEAVTLSERVRRLESSQGGIPDAPKTSDEA